MLLNEKSLPHRSSHLPERSRSHPRSAAPGNDGLGRSRQRKACQTSGPPRIHVDAARGHHGSVLARDSGEFPLVPASGLGIAAITKFNIDQFAYMVNKTHSLREGDGTLLDNCILMWGSGLEDGNKHARENLPFIVAGRGGGSIKTGQFLANTKGNQGDLLTTLLACAGVPLDRPIGIAKKEIGEMKAGG